MPTLAQIYEDHAEDCIRAAARTDDPKQRDVVTGYIKQRALPEMTVHPSLVCRSSRRLQLATKKHGRSRVFRME